MNSSDTERERFVVPQWLHFQAALAQNELFAPARDEALLETRETEQAFSEGLASFREAPGPFLAAELLGVAVQLGRKDEARELAEHVVSAPITGPLAFRLAQKTLGRWTAPPVVEQTLRGRIREARTWVRRFPTDAIAWIEQARLYSIIGQKRQAERSIERALRLAPFDRFVVRAAVRFFIHRDDWARANVVAGMAAKATNDPWLISLWISTGSKIGKVPPGFRAKFTSALAAPNRFHNSELIEACATHEVMEGSERTARRGFKEAWRLPAKTVITHSQWVLREKMPELAGTTPIDFSQSAEAMAWVWLMRLEFVEAVQSAREWALEEPYSTAPFMHGSFVDTLRENYEEAEALAIEGLRANPGHPGLINNLAYSLVGQNRVAEAAAWLSPLKHEFEHTNDVALIATWGLVLMKQGAHAEGRKYYVEAIERAKKQGDQRLALRAVLNYLTAEVLSGGAVEPNLLSSTAEALLKASDARIVATAERLQRQLRSNQSLFATDKDREALGKFEKSVTQAATDLRKLIASSTAKESHLSHS